MFYVPISSVELLGRKAASLSLNPTSKWLMFAMFLNLGRTVVTVNVRKEVLGGFFSVVFIVTERPEGCSVINEKMAP